MEYLFWIVVVGGLFFLMIRKKGGCCGGGHSHGKHNSHADNTPSYDKVAKSE